MHRILKRQLDRSGIDSEKIAPEIQNLLQLISNTYDDFDEDREILDRSLSLSSVEFLEKSKKLTEAKEKLDETVKERTKQLRETQARLIASIESLSLGFLILDNKGSVFHSNRMLNRLLELSDASSIKEIETQLKGKLDLETLFHKSLQSNQPIESKNLSFGKRAINIYITPIALNTLEVIGAVIVVEDSTKERQIDKAKSEFVSLASHQLRTPLTIVKWHVEAVSHKIYNQPFEHIIKKNIDYIEIGTKRMIALVQALLNASRIELGKLAIMPEAVDLPGLCHTVFEELIPEIKEKNLVINEAYAKDLPKVTADPNIVSIIVQNLVTNAVKYTPNEGTVTVNIGKATSSDLNEKGLNGEFISLAVSDSGYGIPEEQQSKIFTKLFRADNVKLLKLSGTGLGLYITKSIVEAAGGKIWFSSKEGKGSTFYVLIPVTWVARKEGSTLTSEEDDLLYT